MSDVIGISLLGAGNVGSGVIEALAQGRDRHAGHVGRPLALRRVLVRDPARARAGVDAQQVTTDLDAVLADDETRIVVELMGGEQPAFDYISRALAAGRHVVTANKEVMAKRGAELLATARPPSAAASRSSARSRATCSRTTSPRSPRSSTARRTTCSPR
jgi:homoserine dehydrogenase